MPAQAFQENKSEYKVLLLLTAPPLYSAIPERLLKKAVRISVRSLRQQSLQEEQYVQSVWCFFYPGHRNILQPEH